MECLKTKKIKPVPSAAVPKPENAEVTQQTALPPTPSEQPEAKAKGEGELVSKTQEAIAEVGSPKSTSGLTLPEPSGPAITPEVIPPSQAPRPGYKLDQDAFNKMEQLRQAGDTLGQILLILEAQEKRLAQVETVNVAIVDFFQKAQAQMSAPAPVTWYTKEGIAIPSELVKEGTAKLPPGAVPYNPGTAGGPIQGGGMLGNLASFAPLIKDFLVPAPAPNPFNEMMMKFVFDSFVANQQRSQMLMDAVIARVVGQTGTLPASIVPSLAPKTAVTQDVAEAAAATA